MKRADFTSLMLAIIIIFLVFRSCGIEEENKKLSLKYEEASKIKDSLGRTITVKDAEIVTNQQSMQDLRAKLFETTEKYNKKVKEVKALIAQGTEVIIRDKEVPYLDSVKMKQWKDSVIANCGDVIQYYEDSAVIIGTNAKDSTAYYKIDATIGKNNLKINEIKFIDSQYVAFTQMKGGILKKDTNGRLKLYLPSRTRIEIKHTNPHFQNTGVDAFFYDKKNKFNTNSFFSGGVFGVSVALLLIALL
jgi:hypothetical protein